MTWANARAATLSRSSTDECGGIAPHNCSTAATSPAPVVRNASPDRASRVAGFAGRVSAIPNVIAAGGTPMATTKHAVAKATAVRPGPTGMSPADQPGRHPHGQNDQPGQHDRNQLPARPRLVRHGARLPEHGEQPPADDRGRQGPGPGRTRGIPPGDQRPQAHARDHGQADQPEQQHGDTQVPDHPVQAALGVHPPGVNWQALQPLQRGDVRTGGPVDLLQVGADRQPDPGEDHQRRPGLGQPAQRARGQQLARPLACPPRTQQCDGCAQCGQYRECPGEDANSSQRWRQWCSRPEGQARFPRQGHR